MPRFGDRLPALLVWLGSLLLAGVFGTMVWLAMRSDTQGLGSDFAHAAAEQAITVRATETGLMREARTLATALTADPLLGAQADMAGASTGGADTKGRLRRRLEHYLDGLADQGVARIAIYPEDSVKPLVSLTNAALATRLPGADRGGLDEPEARLVVGDTGVFVRALAPLAGSSRVVIDIILNRELRALDARVGGGVALLSRLPQPGTPWTLTRRTRPEITAWLNDAELPAPSDKLRHRVVDAHGRHFLLTVVPLHGGDGAWRRTSTPVPRAAIAVWQDVTAELAAYHAARFGTLLRWGGAWVLAQLCLLGLLLGTRRATRRQMAASQRRLQKIASQTPGMIYQFRRSPAGHYSFPYASEAIRTLYEMTPEQAREGVAPLFAMIDARDLPEVTRRIEQSAETLAPWQCEYRVHYRDGRIAWLAGQAVAEPAADGGVLWHGFVHDVTERKRIEEMKNGFVATVSHELRTPLTSISGALGLLAGGAMGEVPERMRPMLDIAHQNAQRLGLLIDDLLDMDKLAAGKVAFDMRPQALMPLVEQALAANRGYAERHDVHLHLGAREDDARVAVDAARFQQVMANLLSNAIKFSPPGALVEVSVTAGEQWLCIAVIDQGPGVPAAFRARIFEKFSQADDSATRRQGGTGLGLAITRELVERMRGRIDFSSVEGQGARFFVELPRASDAPEPSAGGNGAERVLYVEDDPDLADVVRAMARGLVTLEVAPSLSEARRRLQARDYRLVLLDLELGDGSGWDLLPLIGSRRPRPAVVIVSGHTLEASQRARVDGVIAKGEIASRDFPARLRRWLAAQTPS